MLSEGIKETLHAVSQGFLIPAMAVLLLLLAVTAAIVGSLIAEALSERRRLKENIPRLVSQLHKKSAEEMEGQLRGSGLLKRQKRALLELLSYRALPHEEQRAIAKKLIAQEEAHYDRILGWTEMISKIAPMFGLMGTLIPLGPGIMALGQGDTKTLSDSILVAFDTTVAGLISAAVCVVITRLRRGWYEEYMVSMESIMECILEEVEANEQAAARLQPAE